jgi:hypothetical protein
LKNTLLSVSPELRADNKPVFQIQMLTLSRSSSPSLSDKRRTSNPDRRHWASLAKPGLGVALAMGVLTAGQAQALTISIYNLFSFGSSKYRTYLADQPISWTQARNYALSLGGGYDLVSINSTEENIAIFNQIVPTLNGTLWGTGTLCCGGGEYLTGPWIGLFQPPGSTEPAGNWQWVDGTSLTSNGYSNWLPGMPNNSLGGDNFGNILALSSLYQWGWNDAIDNAVIEFNGTGPVLAFVVEDETNGAPGPLPIFGAGAAFGFSRKLRKRIKGNTNPFPTAKVSD